MAVDAFEVRRRCSIDSGSSRVVGLPGRGSTPTERTRHPLAGT
jgi:hypothetical protein